MRRDGWAFGMRRREAMAVKRMLKKFERELLRGDWTAIRDGLEVKLCPSPDGGETFILCRSRDRREKEKAMHERFEKRIEDGLRQIEAGCRKRKYKVATVAKRLGKLLGRNSRAAGLFDTDVIEDAGGRAQLVWKKVDAWRDWAALSEGSYLLRSNITGWTPDELWTAYIQLTEAEAAFRIHKTDLRVRPIGHQKQDRVLAHILVCFLAMSSGRHSASAAPPPASATSRGASSPKSAKSASSTCCYPHEPAFGSASDASPGPPSTRQS